MSNPSNPESKPRIITRRNLLIGGATLGAVGVGVALQAALKQVGKEVTSAPAVAASGITPPPETPLSPTAVPPIPTLAPRPTNAATATSVPTEAATNAPFPTAQSTEAPTTVATVVAPTEVAPASESIITKGKVYGPGDMIDPKTNKTIGKIVVVGTEDGLAKGSQDVLVYYSGEKNSRSVGPDIFTQKPTGPNSFEGEPLSYAAKGIDEARAIAVTGFGLNHFKGILKQGGTLLSAEMLNPNTGSFVQFNLATQEKEGKASFLNECKKIVAFAFGSDPNAIPDSFIEAQVDSQIRSRYQKDMKRQFDLDSLQI